MYRQNVGGEIGRWALRLVLAYALLLQTVLGAATSVAHAGKPLPASLSELCTPSGHADGQAPQPSHLTLCCLLGCAGGAGGLMGPPKLWDAPKRAASLAEARPAGEAAHTVPCVRHSFEARGPPERA